MQIDYEAERKIEKTRLEKIQDNTIIYFPQIELAGSITDLVGKKIIGVYEEEFEIDDESVYHHAMFNTDKGWVWYMNTSPYINGEILQGTGICLGEDADKTPFLFWDGYGRSYNGFQLKNLEKYVDLGLARIGLLGFVEDETKKFEAAKVKRDLENANQAITEAKKRKRELLEKLKAKS